MKKFILSVFAYFILVFIIAVTWHVALFNQQYLGFGMRKEPIFLLGLLSMIIQGVICAYLYPKVAKEDSPVYEGLKFGLIIAFFMGSYGYWLKQVSMMLVQFLPTSVTKGRSFLFSTRL